MIGPETNQEQWKWRKKKKITIIVWDFQASTKYTGGRESKTHLIQDGQARLGELEQGMWIQLSRKRPPAWQLRRAPKARVQLVSDDWAEPHGTKENSMLDLISQLTKLAPVLSL